MCCAVVVVSHIERDANNSNSIDILLLLFPINALLREHECISIYELDRSAFRRHACPAVVVLHVNLSPHIINTYVVIVNSVL